MFNILLYGGISLIIIGLILYGVSYYMVRYYEKKLIEKLNSITFDCLVLSGKMTDVYNQIGE